MATYQIRRINNNNITIDGSSNAHLVSLTGTGIPPVKRILDGGTNFDGKIDRGYILEPRRMVMTLFANAATRSAMEDLRDTIADMFKPNSAEDLFSLRITKDNGDVRQIDCALDGEMDLPLEVDRFAENKIVVPLIAANPIWYDPTEQNQQVTITTSGQIINMNYAGTWFEYPRVQLRGAITNPAIAFTMPDGGSETVSTTGSIPTGVSWLYYYTIGDKKAADNGASQFDLLNDASIKALARTVLAPPDEMLATQTCTISGSALDGNTQFTLLYHNRYIAL